MEAQSIQNSKRKKLLVIWWYDRDDLREIFTKNHERFELVFLFYKFKSDEPKEIPYKTYYWTDFSSPYELLDREKPDKIVFGGLDSNYPIALNIAAKNRGIKTYYLEHGLRFSLQANLEAESQISIQAYKENERKYTDKTRKKWHSLFYLLRSLRLRNIGSLFLLAHYVYRRYTLPVTFAMLRVQFPLRNSDYYITFTRAESQYLIDRDAISEDQLMTIGSPFFDEYFREEDQRPSGFSNYFLLIDTPYWDGVVSKQFSLNYDDRDRFYLMLNEYAERQGAKLLIKLHPLHFGLTNLPDHPNLQFIRHFDNMKGLLKEAKGVFGFFSSLIVPAIYINEVVLFKVGGNSYLQDYAEEIGVVKVLDIRNMSVDDIAFIPKQNLQKFVDDFLYKTDGQATERLARILEA